MALSADILMGEAYRPLPLDYWPEVERGHQSSEVIMRENKRLKPRWCRQCEQIRNGIAFSSSWDKECRNCIDGPEKFCARCREVKPKAKFTRSADRWKDGLFPYCKSCLKATRRSAASPASAVSASESLQRSLGLA